MDGGPPGPPTTNTSAPGRGQLRTDAAEAVRQVVAGRRHHDRIDAVREGHEHGVGVRHQGEVGQQPTPRQATHRPEPEGGQGRVRGTVAGAAGSARLAGAAGDLERHDHPVADLDRRDPVPDGDHVGHALVAERVRARQRVDALEDPDVEVAGGDGDRPDEGGAVGQLGLGRLLPVEGPRTVEDEALHVRGRRRWRRRA
jgi:hypothetical protein